MAMELVESKETRSYFAPEANAEQLVQGIALKNGLAFYGTHYGARRRPMFSRGLPIMISPPLSITAEEVDDMVNRLDRSSSEWEDALGVS